MDKCPNFRCLLKHQCTRCQNWMPLLQDEWVCILPIVIHRILAQYQDIQNYKKGELGKLEHSIVETSSSAASTSTKRS